jgi:hypothetical protein
MATSATKKLGPNARVPVAVKSPVWGEAVQRVSVLSKARQEAIAAQILETLDSETDPANVRFHELIEKKYTLGLSHGEVEELAHLEAEFEKSEEIFYSPILARLTEMAKSSSSRKVERKSK